MSPVNSKLLYFIIAYFEPWKILYSYKSDNNLVENKCYSRHGYFKHYTNHEFSTFFMFEVNIHIFINLGIKKFRQTNSINYQP
jgi:hypothetical protein